ncbi:hypothetical protein BDU57DRAFT_556154 [Ampelomyces quisqualis]|uniref:Uncharacterized protein n=1 Tax=Ampelomyces quisqualis TaxID=50730 RepID=A0A6A5QLI2_AMPQU|nr:hypothetical protein BDU57DRAFT_556154 [Ampelomyces quisqualis]
MSPGINRARRPIPLRLISAQPTQQNNDNQNDALQQRALELFEHSAETTITLIRTPSPRSTSFTSLSPQTRHSTTSRSASTTTTSAAKSSSPTRTVFVTIASVPNATAGERETSQPSTKTIFLSAVPQTMLATSSALSIGTGLTGAAHSGTSIKRPADAGFALLVILILVMRRRKQKTKSDAQVSVRWIAPWLL